MSAHDGPTRAGDAEGRLVDPAFDAAWRAQSGELPPVALDAAILADAHRALKPGPRSSDDALAEAREPERWWWPLAAAAVIGAIAFGVIQLLPREQAAGEKIVSDTPPVLRPVPSAAPAPVTPSAKMPAQIPVEPVAPPAESRTTAPRSVSAEFSAPTAQPPTPAAAKVIATPPPTASTGAPASPSAAGTSPRDAQAGVGASRDRQAAPAGATSDGEAQREIAAAPPAGIAPQPFPVGPRGDAQAVPRSSVANREREEAARLGSVQEAPRSVDGVQANRATATAKDESARAGMATGAPGAPPSAFPAAPMLAAPKPAATAAPGADARRDAIPRTRDEWIARIRELRRDGREADAQSALNAFRNAYPDADARLPPELRDWAASVRR